jgi:hypothetical protein
MSSPPPATSVPAARGQTHLTFGRNEPALHHYHQAFRAALGRRPLPRSTDGPSTLVPSTSRVPVQAAQEVEVP